MNEASGVVERRRDLRVLANGSVTLGGDHVAHARLLDLSANGLRCRVTDGIPPVDGVTVPFDLRIDGRDGGWLHLTGMVENRDGGEIVLGLVPDLCTDGDAFAQLLRTELRSASDSLAAARILLIDPEAPRRGRYAERLRSQGCDVTEVATPLEAIEHLGESQSRPAVIAVADTDPARIADELRAYLRDEHGEIIVIAARV